MPDQKVHSVVLRAQEELWLANGYFGLRQDTTPVRIAISLWYASPTEWRVERTYIVPPPQRALWSAFLTPTVSVRNGNVAWTYDANSHTATRVSRPGRPSIYNFEVAAFPVRVNATNLTAPTIQALLRRLADCDTPVPSDKPKLLPRREVIAGHMAIAIDFGDRPCGWNSNAAHESMGRRIVSIDQQTHLVLKVVLHSVFNPRALFERVIATVLRYNVSIPPTTFTFTAPRGTRVLSDVVQTPAPAVLQPLSAVERQISFHLYLPSALPSGLHFKRAALDGAQHVTLSYGGTHVHLTLLEGPLGCCLDADPERYNIPVALPRGNTAYSIDMGTHYGGLLLWWDQENTFVALTSSTVRESDLIQIAASIERGGS